MKAREVKRAKLVAKYAAKKAALKAAGEYEALQLLQKNASSVRLHNRCSSDPRCEEGQLVMPVSREFDCGTASPMCRLRLHATTTTKAPGGGAERSEILPEMTA